MKAIEFIAQAEDGTIKVPKKYLKNVSGKVRVILLIEKEEQLPRAIKKKKFSALAIKTQDIHFSRDEANSIIK